MALSPPTGSRGRLAILVVASVTLITFGLRDAPVVRDVREVAATVVSPVEGAVETVTDPVRDAWHGVTDYDELKDENERLRDEVAETESQRVRTSDAEEQLADLSAVLNLPFAAGVPKVTARVVSGPRSNFSHAVEIDKGTDDGVMAGMPAVTGGGLVGQVSQASASTARVELLTDPEFRVGVRLATTGDLGTARGQGRDDPLAVDSAINPRADVPRGTGVVTSGVDRSAYPPGIPVGTVASTRDGSGGLALELVVDPIVDVDQLSYLTVLQWLPG
jgi:rod shape-determining protein MreC